ncbi:hypothetical protein NMY22_g14188 [Coprinellus aureogranulatus]|nr:hypothetical protein NMY22_g14188 [Coprinellus aureogranulatus]
MARRPPRIPTPKTSTPPRTFRLLLSKITLAFSSDAVSVNPSSGAVIKTKRWWSFSLRRFGRKAAVVANVGASVAEAVPVLGAPVKGALEACIKVHTILEKRCQNAEAIQQLVCKLECLEAQLCRHSKSALDEWLIQRLGETESALQRLAAEDGLDYEHVASSITQCERDITFFMGQLSLGTMRQGIGTLESQNEKIKRQNEEIKRQNEDIMRQNDAHTALLQAIFMGQGTSQGPSLISFSIWVVDPWGVEHMFLQIPCSFDALAKDLLFRYARDDRRRPILEQYLGHNLFELSRDSGDEVTVVTEQDLPTLDKDSKLVVSVVAFRRITVKGIQCPLCKRYIAVSFKGVERVYCQTCDKNVQVGLGDDTRDGYTQEHEGEDSLADLRQIVIKTLPSPGSAEHVNALLEHDSFTPSEQVMDGVSDGEHVNQAAAARNTISNRSRHLPRRRGPTLSVVSDESEDGTSVNTVIGPRTPSVFNEISFEPAYAHDPLKAVQEWREKEKAISKRRPRPGVVFDVKYDPNEENKPRPRKISSGPFDGRDLDVFTSAFHNLEREPGGHELWFEGTKLGVFRATTSSSQRI